MAQVLIKNGFHAGKVVSGETFEIVRPLSVGSRGPFLLVNGTGNFRFPQRNFKIYVEKPDDFEISGEDAAAFMQPAARPRPRDSMVGASANFIGTGNFFNSEPESNETDDEIRARLSERFDIMERMVGGCAQGKIKGLIISGAPGTGKSFGVEHALERDSIMDKLSFDADNAQQDPRRVARDRTFKPRYQFVKGYATAPALFKTLYEYSEPNEILVFDDCDSVLYDDVGLNLLKSALDTSGKRTLSWLSGNRVGGKDSDVVPDSFEFKGSVIFITNIDFEASIARNSKISPHLDALMDRCLYLDLTIATKRDKLIRIDTVCRDLKMLEKKGLEPAQIDEVLEWTHVHADRFPRLSLRKVDQLADIRLADKTGAKWQREAEIMLLKGLR